MTTQQDDLKKLGAALRLTTGKMPTVAERIAAAEVLMQPKNERTILDPGSFAVEIPRHLVSGDLSNDWYLAMAPEEEAEFRQMSDRLHQVANANGVDLSKAVGDFGATVNNLMLAMFDAGVRQGAAYENLRRSMLGETILCGDCYGHGRTKDDRSCNACGGSGTVSVDA